ncbi:c-type cytochrome [Grimontia sp. NTOU-MAR1]|uniref:c-type cytochrome n=1 Tax=Grimontia sp. NTOU-MAR1 TaxID=3111011 RepID=UPI002DBCCDF9|nr:cytochrome c5 family protein [Grimontia sp. NTOU-MAR1]WRV96735.1 cytochrome c5 family protein [Grimontia sp. NTOU-MAR1]
MSAKGIFLRRLAVSAVTALFLMGTAHAADMSEEAIAERIAPVGSVYLDGEAPVETAAAPAGPRTGDSVYNTYCMACHATGAAGAPKVSDPAAWEPRLAQGRDTLNKHAIEGFNGMPARGTCMDCSDDEIVAAIDHMLSL